MTATLGFGASRVVITAGRDEAASAGGTEGSTLAGPVGTTTVDWGAGVQDAILRGDVNAAASILDRAPQRLELGRFRLLLRPPEVHASTGTVGDTETRTGPWTAYLAEHIVDRDASLRRLRDRLADRSDRLDLQIRRSR